MTTIISLSLADSIKDIIDQVSEKTFGPILLVIIVIVFYMVCTQIITSILTIGFQWAKLEFTESELAKKLNLENVQ